MSQDRILLISPFINPKTQRKFVSSIINVSFPLSLGHLIGYLMEHVPFPVSVIDEQINPINDVEETVLSMGRPKIVGISTMTSTSKRAFELARAIKKVIPEALVVLGGVHPTVTLEECLKEDAVDIVVSGEGEETLRELVQRVFNEKDYSDVCGISYKENGHFKHNQNRALIEDLDILPQFPYHVFENNKERYNGFASLQTSRGCPYGCVFCSQRSVSGRTYRYHSKERVLKDLEYIIGKYKPDNIRLIDDNIGANRKRLMDLLDGIIDKNFHKKVSFTAPLRGDNIDEEMVVRLKEANFSFLSFGLETASESLMKLINKGESVDDVVKAIHMTKRNGITTATTVIFGLPTETNRDRWNAIKLVNSLPLDSVRFNILTPYPGTPVFERLKKENKIFIKKDWENFSVQYMWEGDDLPYVPAGTDRYELIFLTMFANLWFYLNPRGIWKTLTTPLAGGNVVPLPRKWYLSKHFFRITRVGFYLVYRFVVVVCKMIAIKLLLLKSTKRNRNTPDEW